MRDEEKKKSGARRKEKLKAVLRLFILTPAFLHCSALLLISAGVAPVTPEVACVRAPVASVRANLMPIAAQLAVVSSNLTAVCA